MQLLPSRNHDQDFWWKVTGRQLAVLLEAAGYPIERQYNTLLFHYHWAIPYLGPAPASGVPAKWPSQLSVDGSPIEYSWKWNTKTKAPDVRYTMEPMSEFTGTELDPLNQRAFRELLHKLSQFVPDVDLAPTDYFISTLFDHDRSALMKAVNDGVPLQFSSTALAFEFLSKGLLLKTYYAPRKLETGHFTLADWDKAIRGYYPESKALDVVYEFLKTSHEGKLLNPYHLAVDNVKGGRLKFYFQSPHRTFTSVREILSIGGRVYREGLEAQFLALRDFLNAITGQSPDFPEDGEPPIVEEDVTGDMDTDGHPELMSGYLYYFDIAPGATLPEIRFYVPIRRYCKSDLDLAKALTGWMEAHGRGAYCQQYLDLAYSLAEHRDLAKDRGLQRYIACLLAKNGEIEVTTYLAPETYEQVRRAQDRKSVV